MSREEKILQGLNHAKSILKEGYIKELTFGVGDS